LILEEVTMQKIEVELSLEILYSSYKKFVDYYGDEEEFKKVLNDVCHEFMYDRLRDINGEKNYFI
jgi:hypothetical protein